MLYNNPNFELNQDPISDLVQAQDTSNKFLNVSPMVLNKDPLMNVNNIQILLNTDITKNVFSFKSISVSINSIGDNLHLLVCGELVATGETVHLSTELFKSQTEEYEAMLNTTLKILDNINSSVFNYYKYAINNSSDDKKGTTVANTHKNIVDGVIYLLCECENQYRKINKIPPVLREDMPYILTNNAIKKVVYGCNFELNFKTIVKGF